MIHTIYIEREGQRPVYYMTSIHEKVANEVTTQLRFAYEALGCNVEIEVRKRKHTNHITHIVHVC